LTHDRPRTTVTANAKAHSPYSSFVELLNARNEQSKCTSFGTEVLTIHAFTSAQRVVDVGADGSSEAVMMGDRLATDIREAHQQGMVAILVTGTAGATQRPA